MQDGVGARTWRGIEQTGGRAGFGRYWNAQIKYRGCQMLGSVNFAVDSENRLSARNVDIVDRLKAEVSETGAQGSARGQSETDAGAASVKIEGEVRTPARDFGRPWGSRCTPHPDCRQKWERRPAPPPPRSADPGGLASAARGRAWSAPIPQRAQANDCDPRAGGEAIEHGAHFDKRALILRFSLRRSASPGCRRESDTRACTERISNHSGPASIRRSLCTEDRPGCPADPC